MNRVLITGADRGLGYCLCEEFLHAGFQVFAGWFSKEYQLLGKLALQYPGMLERVPMDLGSTQSLKEAVQIVSQKTDSLDMLIDVAAFLRGPIGTSFRTETPIRPDLINKSLRVNAIGALECTSLFLPLLRNGQMKRLCYVSSEVSSVNLIQRTEEFAYTSSKTALNMAVKMMHNSLYSQGFTFRIYAPGWMRLMLPDGSKENKSPLQIDPEESARIAKEIFLSSRDDEQCVHQIDYLGGVWPF